MRLPRSLKMMNSLREVFRRDDFKQRRCIFCVNSGRAGSRYLAEILNTAKGVRAFHEPAPTMTGCYLKMINLSEYRETRTERKIKWAAIRKTLGQMRRDEVYCETSHMFVKTFFDVVVEELSNVEVIILRRDLSSVLKSFIEMGYFSKLNRVWPDWMSSPNAVTRAVECIDQDRNLDQYDLCIAYLIDIEARAQRFMRTYPEVPVYEVRLEQLNSSNDVYRFFRELCIAPTHKTEELIGRPKNRRDERKRRLNRATSLDLCRERIEAYVRKAEIKGISLPELHLDWASHGPGGTNA